MSNVYDRAIQVLHDDGWTQGDYHHIDKGYCAVGALGKAVGMYDTEWARVNPHTNALWAEAEEYLNNKFFGTDSNNSVVLWNDTQGRTADDVIHLFKQASEQWDLDHPEPAA